MLTIYHNFLISINFYLIADYVIILFLIFVSQFCNKTLNFIIMRIISFQKLYESERQFGFDDCLSCCVGDQQKKERFTLNLRVGQVPDFLKLNLL